MSKEMEGASTSDSMGSKKVTFGAGLNRHIPCWTVSIEICARILCCVGRPSFLLEFFLAVCETRRKSLTLKIGCIFFC